MLLARHRPVSGFRKRVPVAAAGLAKARGFGPRQKLVAAPRKALRLGAPLSAAATMVAADEATAPAEWASNIDWVGDAGQPVAARANGHAPEAITDLPPPDAIPSPPPEMRTLN
jgi:hypothetical protein